MPARKPFDYTTIPDPPNSVLREDGIEAGFIGKLQALKYDYRPDITNRATLEQNFREKFEALNRVRLTDTEFAVRFLKKCDLGRTISRYMVLLAGEQKLMIMRPYQVYAVQHMVTCIDEDNGNGFVWHTTGSGKTLTSFKASTLAILRDTLLPKLLSRELSFENFQN